jgi:hypothetical protein
VTLAAAGAEDGGAAVTFADEGAVTLLEAAESVLEDVFVDDLSANGIPSSLAEGSSSIPISRRDTGSI